MSLTPSTTLAPAASRDLLALARRYDRPGPRYTSYPTALDFSADFSGERYAEHLRRADLRADDPLSIYVHIPFCIRRCSFCACSVIASPRGEEVSDPYLGALLEELRLVTTRAPHRRRVAQLHLGGGTPTYLTPEQLRGLFRALRGRFEFVQDAEISIEVDPRVTTEAHLETLAEVGVNRVSVGIQDFDEAVQRKIGREQTLDETAELFEGARQRGLTRLNADLVYGLPGQSLHTLEASIETLARLRPSRVALYGYAHLPQSHGNQRSILASDLAVAERRLELWQLAHTHLVRAGYEAVAMDHFALPDDGLVTAEREGRLQRNFMGYTVNRGTDLIALGVTAIGDVSGAFVQNTKKLSRYYDALRAGDFPVERGLERSADDEVRRRIIEHLMCCRPVDRFDPGLAPAIHDFGSFDTAFATELAALSPLIQDGLLEDDGRYLRVTARGRPFVRNIALAFDAYRNRNRHTAHVFSRTV